MMRVCPDHAAATQGRSVSRKELLEESIEFADDALIGFVELADVAVEQEVDQNLEYIKIIQKNHHQLMDILHAWCNS